MKVYVSGAIAGHENWTNIWRREWKTALKKAGFGVYDPWIDTSRKSGFVYMIREDLRKIISTDILLVNGNIPSWGTAQEVVYARIFGTHVYTICSLRKVPFWLDYHSDEVFKTLEEFIGWHKTRGV